MKLSTIAPTALLILLVTASFLPAQEKAQKEESNAASVRQEGPQAKVQIVFTEYDGEKKIKSLPYTLVARIGLDGQDGPWSKIRMGSRVPVVTGGGTGGTNYQWQYVDVGTSIDCTASAVPNGRYRLSLMMERSWPESESVSEAKPLPPDSDSRAASHQPIIRQFRSDSSVTLKEGQTVETNVATDPVSGKVIKLEVSLNLIK